MIFLLSLVAYNKFSTLTPHNMANGFISPVSETLLELQRPSKEHPIGRIRLDRFNYGFNTGRVGGEACAYIDIDIEIYATGERINQVFRGKIMDGAKEQVMYILNQIK